MSITLFDFDDNLYKQEIYKNVKGNMPLENFALTSLIKFFSIK
jgi:hypothetical protein